MMDEHEAETPVTPKLSSEEDRARHNLTHLPYASWYEACVTGRGQEEQHRRKKDPSKPMPVLAIGGAHSYPHARGRGREPEESLKRCATHVRGAVVEGSGHFVPEEQPEKLNALLLEFFAE